MDQPYAEANSQKNGSLTPRHSSAEASSKDYGALLALQPPSPRSFTVTFLSNSNTLTPGTAPAGELIVSGYTDNTGSEEPGDSVNLAARLAAGLR